MEFTTKQLQWLKIAEAKDLLKIRTKVTNKEYSEIESKWRELHKINIDYWSQPENWKSDENRSIQMQIGTREEWGV